MSARCVAALAVALALGGRVPAAVAARHEPMPDPLANVPAWREVFADEPDTVVFLTPTALVRAPFSSVGGDTLWRAPDAERLAWVATSPDRRHLAWLSRPSDRAATTLWLWDVDGVRRRAGFAPLIPSDYGVPRFTSAQPALDDAEPTGGRFTAASTMSRSNCADALVWDGSGAGVWLGYRDGIALAPTDTAAVRVESPALAFALHRLDPAPLLYAEVLRLGQGRDAEMQEESPDYGRSGSGRSSGIQDPNAPSGGGKRVEAQPGAYLLYPGARALKAFHIAGFDPADPWTASATTVWWVDHARRVSAVRAADPRGTFEFEDADPIVWLEYLDARHALVRARGRGLVERPEASGGERMVLATGSPIRDVLSAAGDAARYVVTSDSLLVWDPATGATRGVALEGAAPTCVLVAAAGARVLVSGVSGRDALRLDRLDAGATRLVSLAAPVLRKGAVAITPSGRRLLLFPAGERIPRVAEVCELASAAWGQVALPELLGWERVTPE